MELRDYLNVIRVRKWTIIQAVVIVAVTALVLGLVQPKMYQGEAKVLISEKDAGAALFGSVLPEFSSQPERGLQTQVQLMQLRPLAETTIRKLDLQTTPEALLGRVKVTAVGQTNIVLVRATWSDPEVAANVANSMAAEYVAWSKQARRESIKAAADEVERRLSESRQEILELGRRISAEGETSEELAAELQIATGSYTTLAEKLEQLRINEQLETGSGRVVSEAVVSRGPIAPRPMRNAILGLGIGLVFGLGMAFLYEYLDNTIKSNEEIEKLLGVPVLGHIPLERFEKGAERRLTIVEKPGSAAAEAYRSLRNALDFVNFEHQIKTILVTSAVPAEGKSTVASNLAASLAQAGQRVALVSCDFRRPTTDAFFGVQNTIGLSDVLTGRHSMKTALQRPGDEQLLVMTAGKMPPNPSELLSSSKMDDVVKNLEEWADWVVIDTPPVLAVADASALSRWVDGVLIVTKAGTSTREATRKACETLLKAGAHLIGAVVWGLAPGVSAVGYGYYYGSYYGGYYAAAYGETAGKRSKKKRSRETGAGSEAAVSEAPEGGIDWVPVKSPGRRAAEIVGRVMAATLGFLVVIAVAAVAAYFVGRYMGVDVLQLALSMLR